jgi:WD40 repeat protein
MPDPGLSEKLKVFISYSRRDASEFADELVAGLELASFAPFLDRHDISAGEDWEARLGGLIAQSDTVVFVVTPESVKSQRCVWEVERTLGLSKRLLPVIHKPVADFDIPSQLSRLQFVRFDNRGLARPLAELAEALRLDLDWIREHTRLGELAARWQARGKAESLLLRGDDLDAATVWTAQRKAGAPEITELQRAFLHASDEAENARLSKERTQLEEMRLAQAATARHQKRAGRLLWTIAALVLVVFGYVIWKGYNVERRELVVFTSLATQAMKEERFDRAMRFALQAYPARGSLPWLTPFSTELEGKLAGSAQSARLHRVLKGHSSAVNTVEFSSDGKRLLTASWDATARIWDVESGQAMVVMQGHTGGIHMAVFSPDGTRVLTASDDATARIWDATSGWGIAILTGHRGDLQSAVYSADGKRIVTASSDGTARLWDAEDGHPVAVLAGHEQPVKRAKFSPDSKRVITVAWDRTARLWDAESGQQIAALGGHELNFLNDASFSPDGRRVVTAGLLNTQIWNAESGQEIAALNGSTIRAEFGPDGRVVLLTASEGNAARIWDVATGEEAALSAPTDKVSSARFSADGAKIVTASSDFTVRVVARHQKPHVLRGHTNRVSGVIFSPDASWIASASEDGTARLWDERPGNERVMLEGLTHGIPHAAFSVDGRHVVTTAIDDVRVWDAASGKLKAALVGHTDLVTRSSFSQDGRRLVTASFDNTARLWDAESGEQIAVLEGHTALYGAAFSPDGKRIVTTSQDHTARLWDIDSTRETLVLKGHAGTVTSAAFSPDGKRVITASIDLTARLWDVESGREVLVLGGHESELENVAFSLDGKRLVTASKDNTSRLWDAITGRLIAVLRGHTRPVESAQFSPDGRRIVTLDGEMLRLWDVVSAKEIAKLDGISPRTAIFSPDGRHVKSMSQFGAIQQWDMSWTMAVTGDELRERVCSEALVGAAQEFDDAELDDPALAGLNRDDPVARNPCLRRGPLTLDYWTRLPGELWRSARRLAAMD